MDIYGDRTDWQMKDHDSYDTPLEWPKNAFGEELGGGTDSDDNTDDVTAEPTDGELDEVESGDHDHGDGEYDHDHDHDVEDDENVDAVS